jgi:PilZ domain-containing protein
VPENRRSSTRHAVSIPTTLTVDGAQQSCTMVNLSLGGALVSGGEKLALGKRVSIVFTVPRVNHPIETQATVRWADSSGVGLQFDGLRARDVWALNELFKQLA